MNQPSGEVQAYRQLIAELQQELEALKAEQQQQTEAYEARIRELEERLAVDGGGGTDGTEKPGIPMENRYTYTVFGDSVIITGYIGEEALAEIPRELGGLPVKEIGEGAFRNSAVEQVILPEGVESVGWFAFQGSYRLRSVILPASVKDIGYGAFENCSSALKFTCPAGSYAAQYAASYGIPVIAKSE